MKENLSSQISKIKFVCQSCGADFFVYPARVRNARKTNRKILFCSWSCWKKEKVIGTAKKCLICEKIFYCAPSNGGKKFCSKKCMGLGTRNENGNAWKGDSVSYSGLHRWLYRNYEKSYYCFSCMKHNKYMDWANITGEYKRDIKNFITLCRKCHNRFDQGLLVIILDKKYERKHK